MACWVYPRGTTLLSHQVSVCMAAMSSMCKLMQLWTVEFMFRQTNWSLWYLRICGVIHHLTPYFELDIMQYWPLNFMRNLEFNHLPRNVLTHSQIIWLLTLVSGNGCAHERSLWALNKISQPPAFTSARSNHMWAHSCVEMLVEDLNESQIVEFWEDLDDFPCDLNNPSKTEDDKR